MFGMYDNFCTKLQILHQYIFLQIIVSILSIHRRRRYVKFHLNTELLSVTVIKVLSLHDLRLN